MTCLAAAAFLTCPVASQETLTEPESAIQMADAAAPAGVRGHFAMPVQSAGRQNRILYLNSELDYRGERNLTIAILPTAIAQLEARGQDLDCFFIGKNIVVSGAAKRVKIAFFSNGKLTDKYYYQTHVEVRDADQVRLAASL